MVDENKKTVARPLRLITTRPLSLLLRVSEVIEKTPHWTLVLIAIIAGLVFSGGISLSAKFALFGDGEWYAYDYKAQHLTADMSLIHEAGSHAAKLTTRVTFPFTVRILHLNRNRLPLFFLFQAALLTGLTYAVVYRETASRVVAVFSTLFFASTITWSLSIWPATGFSDGTAWILALSALLIPQRTIFLLIPLGVAALWTDERALLSLIACLLVRLWNDSERLQLSELLAWVSIPVVYLTTRLIASNLLHWNTATEGISLASIIPSLSDSYPYLFFTFSLGWILLAADLTASFKNKPLRSLLVTIFVLGVIIISHTVHDITRSITYLFPIFLIPLLDFNGSKTRTNLKDPQLNPLIAFTIITCLLIPNIEIIRSSNFHTRTFDGQISMLKTDFQRKNQ